MNPTVQLVAALHELGDALIDEQTVRESLKHPTHVAVLDPIRAKAKAVMARFFKRQRALLVKQIAASLRTVAAREADGKTGSVSSHSVSEAATSAESKAAALLALPDDTELPNAVTAAMAIDYTSALTAALEGGYDTLAAGVATAGKTVSAEVTAAYLREHSLETLATQLSGTTISRVQNALADAYEAGEDYDGLVAAVREEFAGMADGRAGTIAQTGMNSAYNAGRKQLGVDLGFDEKSWSCDGPNPCITCLANQLDGWIPMDDAFSDGSDLPVAHPGCYCSLDVRAGAGVLAA